jgi:hypothetical protein
MPRPLSHINFPKVITVLAVIFGIGLGTCGLAALAGNSNFALPLGMVALIAMVLSFVGIVVMAIIWAVVQAIGDRGGPGPTKLFDDEDRRER